MVKIHFKTFGCPTNFSESESMSALLKKATFELVDNIEEAFVVILNICTVKGNVVPLREIRKVRENHPHKKIIVAGCITNDIIPEIKEIDESISLISTNSIEEIVSLVEETINDNPIDILTPSENPGEKANLPRIRRQKHIAIMPICSGCTGKCAYCSVRVVKGELISYPMERITEQCRKAIMQGAKEIWITAQDTASYMKDKNENTKLPELIENIAKIPGNFKIRVGMMNINNLMPVLGDIIRVMNNEKVFKFLHLPLQSGSDAILKKMKRKYTTRDFEITVKTLRENIPNLTINTDIITGFPGEAAEHFNESKEFIDKLKPNALFVNKFRPRPGTEAAEMEEQVKGEDAKGRAKALTSIFEWSAYLINKQWLNWTGEVIIEEIGKEGTNTVVGRNLSYKPIIIDNKLKNLNLGDIKRVKITNYSKHDLKGELI